MQNNKETSKFLSLILRHNPDRIDLKLDENGWVVVDELIYKMNKYNKKIDFNLLNEVVETNDKKRFAFNEDKTKIRASQGHSVTVNLDLQPVEPPFTLYHGTVGKFIDSIKNEGLKPMSRQQVHLSKDIETASIVGNRRGKAIVLKIDSQKMYKDGYKFYISENGVWLTDEVPPEYLIF